MVFPSPPLNGHAKLRIATAGEALMDLITEADGRLRPCEGGAVYNLTRALGMQQIGTLYLNPLSQDRFGRGLAEALAVAQVHLAQPDPVPEPTSLAVVGLDMHGKASYSFYREGVADRKVQAQSLNAACAAIESLQMVAAGCLALVAEDRHRYLPWLQAQRATGRMVVVDANLRPAVVRDMVSYRASVMDALTCAHLIKVSDDDLQALGFSHTNPLHAARALLNFTPARWIALTLGAQGAVLVGRDGRTWQARETQDVPVADTVGAGDCFLAGLLAAWLDQGETIGPDWSDDEAVQGLRRATASASLCVMRTGCCPASAAEIAARVHASPAKVVRL